MFLPTVTATLLYWVKLVVNFSLSVLHWSVVNVINALTLPHRNQCSELHLLDVVGADLFADDDRLLQFRRSSDLHGRDHAEMLRERGAKQRSILAKLDPIEK